MKRCEECACINDEFFYVLHVPVWVHLFYDYKIGMPNYRLMFEVLRWLQFGIPSSVGDILLLISWFAVCIKRK